MAAFAGTKEIAKRFERSWETVSAPHFPDGFLNS
jgi:hypothetical protein